MLRANRREQIARIADSWAARSARGLTAEERTERDQWRASDPTHENAWKQAQSLMQSTDGMPRPLGAASPQPHARAPFRPAVAFAGFAAIVAVAGGAIFVERGRLADPEPRDMVYAAATAPSHVRLDDGTVVDLDPGAMIRTDFSGPVRAVLLERGTARFDVAHDQIHPFIVSAADRQVTAIGTRFEVALRQQGVAVTLFQGAIEVAGKQKAPNPSPVRMKPGQRLTIVDGQETLGDVPPADLSASGPHDVPSTPAATIVAEANRATAMPIRFSDPALGQRAIQGRLDTRDTAALAAQIAAALDLVVRRTDSGYLLSTR
ncbi:FecR family protein [Sphingomonas oryzagri]